MDPNGIAVFLMFHIPMFDRYRRTILQFRGVHRFPRTGRETDVNHVAWLLFFAVAALFLAFLRWSALVAIVRSLLVFLVFRLLVRLFGSVPAARRPTLRKVNEPFASIAISSEWRCTYSVSSPFFPLRTTHQ